MYILLMCMLMRPAIAKSSSATVMCFARYALKEAAHLRKSLSSVFFLRSPSFVAESGYYHSTCLQMFLFALTRATL